MIGCLALVVLAVSRCAKSQLKEPTDLPGEIGATKGWYARYRRLTTYPAHGDYFDHNSPCEKDEAHLENVKTDGTTIDIDVWVVARRVKFDCGCDVGIV